MTPLTEDHLATLRSWVGRSYAEMRCWDVVLEAFRLRCVELPYGYAEALERRLFRTVSDPEPWDVVPICNHELAIVNHVALYIGENLIIQSCEESGVVITPLDREPFWSRIARRRGSGERGYLRLRA